MIIFFYIINNSNNNNNNNENNKGDKKNNELLFCFSECLPPRRYSNNICKLFYFLKQKITNKQ